MLLLPFLIVNKDYYILKHCRAETHNRSSISLDEREDCSWQLWDRASVFLACRAALALSVDASKPRTTSVIITTPSKTLRLLTTEHARTRTLIGSRRAS